MKLDLITVAAVGVAGLALATWARGRAAATGADSSVAGQVFAAARAQRQASGAAQGTNLEYMRYWDNPMASTFYSSGSLGD